MNPKLRRFIETTLPMIIGFGFAITLITALFGFFFGVVGVVIYTIVDVLFTSNNTITPSNIKWKGKYYPTLTHLINDIEKNEGK